MKLNKIDEAIFGFFLFIIMFLTLPWTRNFFMASTQKHPFVMGFIKFAILASLGELISHRIKTGNYEFKKDLRLKAVAWGFYGILITLFFPLFNIGVKTLVLQNFLPVGFFSGAFQVAFLSSFLMNIFFAPVFMAMHRISDKFIEIYIEEKRRPKIMEVIELIDWRFFVSFVLFKTIPIFWIPIHTLTFLLPNNFRIIVAAFLSIALGAMLAFKSVVNSDEA